MTAADNFFWTFDQAVSYYRFALVQYIGFHDKGMVLAGAAGTPTEKRRSGKPGIFRGLMTLEDPFIVMKTP